MFRVIFPNRLFIWTIVIAIIAAVLLLWQIQLYTIEADTRATETQNTPPTQA